MKKRKSGFTLVEILIFTGIIGVVSVLLLSVLISFYKSRNTARRLSALQDTTTFVFNDLTQEFHWSDGAFLGAGNPNLDELRLEQIDPESGNINEVVYRVNAEGQFLKNDTAISQPSVEVVLFKVERRTQADELIPCFKIQLGLEYALSNPKIAAEQETTISLRKTKLEVVE